MKCILVLATLILVISAATDKDQWLQFKQKYGRDYRNLREEHRRFSIFQTNLRTIEEHNEKYAKGEKSYYFGVTQFADLTPTEFSSMLNSSNPTQDLKVQTLNNVELSALPSTIDWRDQGVISEVKNQGDCGSCWAFSTTGALEAYYTIKTGTPISLSEQNLMDCSYSYATNGCRGGSILGAYRYVIDHGIATESDYPYQGKDGLCSSSPINSALSLKSFVSLPYNSESDLQKAVGTIGPVSVSVNADGYQFYTGGIYEDPGCHPGTNHGVLVVGYGEEAGTEYWIVKNSYGPEWGEDGYIKMARNKANQCGIASYGVYPVLD